MKDPIERQDALDAIYKCTDIYINNLPVMIDKAETYKAISELSPAQPEIIRCKECEYSADYYHEGDCYCLNPKLGLMYFGGSWEFYCADAERRIVCGLNRTRS